MGFRKQFNTTKRGVGDICSYGSVITAVALFRAFFFADISRTLHYSTRRTVEMEHLLICMVGILFGRTSSPFLSLRTARTFKHMLLAVTTMHTVGTSSCK